MIVKTRIVETKGQREEGGLVPGLRENIEETRQQLAINTLQLKQEKEESEIADHHQDLFCVVLVSFCTVLVYWCVT